MVEPQDRAGQGLVVIHFRLLVPGMVVVSAGSESDDEQSANAGAALDRRGVR